MQPQTIRKVVIAGGGTAGWMAAAALGRQLGSLLDITLVESEDIGTVGVGESTIPTARTFNALLGIDEAEFMRATQATFKLGISFENWGEVDDRYIHSFGQVGKSTWMGGFHHFWLQALAHGFGGDLGDYCLELKAAEAQRFYTGENGPLNYAYHLDAGLYGQFLRRMAEADGVRRVEGKIASVRQRETDGFVDALVMESGQVVEGDFFIDCTGFRGLLIEQTLKAGYEDWSHWLPTNSALAVQTRSTEPAVPYTRAIAHRAGWRWKIPLQHRVGNGLVYCSDHMSDDEAMTMLTSEIEGETLIPPRLIRYRTGRRRRTWDKNVVALGLSSGFVEPLESTSIHLIMIGVSRLMQLFPFGGISQATIDRYNRQADDELEKIRDFIILHYKVTERTDSTFWDQVRTMDIPDSLAHRIALFQESGHVFQAPGELFQVDSWLQVMLGQRIMPRTYHHMGRMMPPQQLKQALDDLKRNIAGTVSRLPQHQAFLDHYCAPAVSKSA
ncbi:tryptophan 7-halogenase [Caulobacter vibrioides]|uniref:tryptophan halogenase family protein n=1 Tax=Caulobacter vibrioides TaxID=155892 RepID=UPI000BB46DE0|nr:tryptophan halogenase family protein [Caulobacter vibrioides]ATC23956.1 tryptophan 7-halogenase [Caulobacter vibrioides]AZH12198.1 tryptophan 7-halogenase [Caulobacter vibrioides]